MARAGQPGGRLSPLGMVSLGLLMLGVCLFAWGAVNLLAQPDPATGSAALTKSRHLPTGSDDTSEVPKAQEATNSGTTVARELLYSAEPERGDIFGALIIPALKQTFPLVQGTGSTELKKGVGHMVDTAMPGESDNCVISGHRDTVFTDLGKLEVEDRLIIETAKGTFTYQIRRIRIVHKDDRTVVVPEDHAVLTVSTCYPFRYVGSAPDRYVLIADLIGRE